MVTFIACRKCKNLYPAKFGINKCPICGVESKFKIGDKTKSYDDKIEKGNNNANT